MATRRSWEAVDPDARATTADIVQGLDRVARLLALLVAEGRTQRENILRLAGVGFTPKDIAELLGTTRNTVSVTLHQAKKPPLKGKKLSVAPHE